MISRHKSSYQVKLATQENLVISIALDDMKHCRKNVSLSKHVEAVAGKSGKYAREKITNFPDCQTNFKYVHVQGDILHGKCSQHDVLYVHLVQITTEVQGSWEREATVFMFMEMVFSFDFAKKKTKMPPDVI